MAGAKISVISYLVGVNSNYVNTFLIQNKELQVVVMYINTNANRFFKSINAA